MEKFANGCVSVEAISIQLAIVFCVKLFYSDTPVWPINIFQHMDNKIHQSFRLRNKLFKRKAKRFFLRQVCVTLKGYY